MDQVELEACRRNYAARQQERRDRQEARRLSVLKAAREAARELLGLGANRLLLFGSVLVPGRFHERSDLDLVVYGLPSGLWSRALGLVEDWPGLSEVEIDLKPADDLTTAFLAFVESQGEIIER